MPVGIMITANEAAAAQAAEVGTLTGNFFEYDPRETMAMIEKVRATNHEGAHRLVTRLADLYGRHLAKASKVSVEDDAPAPKGRKVKPTVQRVYVDRDE